jgi:hypothetical protein
MPVKRFAAVLALAAISSMASAAVAGPAQAAELCVSYDINVNGQGQAGTQCLPAAGAPGLPL